MFHEARWLRRLAVLAMAIGALALAACGEDEQEGGAGAGAAQSQAGADCAGQARAAADRLRAEPPLKVPEEPFDAARARGKALHFIAIVQNPFVQEVYEGYEEAVERIGGRAVFFDGKGQASQWSRGVAQAVSQRAGGIVLFGIAPELVANQLKRAVAADIPIIDVYNGQPGDPLTGGVAAHISADYARSAEALANWMLADSGCAAKVQYFGAKVLTLYNPLFDREPEVFERAGCTRCSFERNDFDLATLATKLGPQVATAVRRAPDTTHVQMAFDSTIPLVVPALGRGGTEVKVIGHDGTPFVLDAIRKDDSPVKATMAFPPEAWIGYAIADQIARISTGAEPVDATIPTRLVDRTNVGEQNADVYAGWAGFEDRFAEQWQGAGGGS
jgi:ribose transport system substrate-binding protein